MMILMKEYGSVLTDRADGKKAAAEIMKRAVSPVGLDFMDVLSLGSSFGDEVILPVAERQGKKLCIHHANQVIQNSIRRIVEDTDIEISFDA